MSAEYLAGAIAAFVIYVVIFAASRLTPQDRRRRVTYAEGHIIGVDQDGSIDVHASGDGTYDRETVSA